MSDLKIPFPYLSRGSADAAKTGENFAAVLDNLSSSSPVNGLVNAGLINQLAYYAASGNAVSGLSAITANRALQSNASGLPIASSVTSTELSYLSGVTSSIQTQLNNEHYFVSVKEYGAIGNGITNDATAIQNAYNAVGNAGGGTLFFPAGNYLIGTTSLVFDKDYVKILGVGNPDTHLNNVAGNSPSTITYTGTGVAITIGNIATQWRQGNSIESIGIVVAENTTCGLDLINTKDSYFKNVSIFGNSGASNFGIRFYGGISCIFDQVQVSGSGTQLLPANYLGCGIQFLPSAFQIASATDLRRCYFHYCLVGVKVTGSIINFNNCDFEANTTGFYQDVNSDVQISDSKWENNTTSLYLAGATGSGVAITGIRNSFFNEYSVQTAIDGSSTVPMYVSIRDTEFASDNASPYIFNAALLTSGTHNIIVENPIYEGTGAASYAISSSGANGVLLVSQKRSFNITGPESINGYLDMVGIANPASPAAGTARFHAAVTQGFTRFEQDNEAATNLVLGRDNVFIAKNTSGGNLVKGQLVYVTGSTGAVPNIALAKADSLTTLPAVGILLDNINNNNFGQVMELGVINSYDTHLFATGKQVYVSPTTAGAFTDTRPTNPNFVQRIGSILNSGVGDGSLLITIAPFIGNRETGTTQAFTFGSTALFQDGLLATPSIAFASETGLGVYKGNTHSLNIVSNGQNPAYFTDTDVVLVKQTTFSSTTASTVPYLDANKILVSSLVTPTELGYVHGVTSAIQTQLNGKEPTVTKGNLTETTSSILTIVGGTGAVIGSGTTIAVTAAASGVSGYINATTQTITGAKTFETQLIGKGTATNNDAAAGYIGEYVVSDKTGTNFPATGNWGDLTSITLSAGDWDIAASIDVASAGSTVTSWYMGISTTTGNSAAGLTSGINQMGANMPSAAEDAFACVPSYRVSLSGSATYYFKYYATFSGGTPTGAGRISARRVR